MLWLNNESNNIGRNYIVKEKVNMNNKTLGITLALLGGICWGISGVSGSYIFVNNHVTSIWMVNVRLILSGICMLIPVMVRCIKEKEDFFRIWKVKANLPSLFFFAIMGLGMCQFSYFSAVKLSNAATATVIQYTAPAFILIYYCILEKRLPSSKQVISLALAMVGVVLLTTKGNITTLTISKQALFFALISALTMVVFNIAPIKLMLKYGTAYVVGWGMLIAGIVMSPFGRPFDFHESWSWGYKATIAFAIVILVGTVFAFGLYMAGVKLAGAETASMVACIEPLTATFATVIMMGTKFAFAELIGIAFILLAVLLLSIKIKKKKQQNDLHKRH